MTMKKNNKNIFLLNLFILAVFGIIILWPVSSDVKGKGIIRSKNYVAVKAPFNGYVSDSRLILGSKISKGQKLLKLVNEGSEITIVSPLNGTIGFLNAKCQEGAYVVEGEDLVSISDPSSFTVLCVFPMKGLDEINEKRKLEVYPNGNLYQLTQMAEAAYEPVPLCGESLGKCLGQYAGKEGASPITLTGSFGLEGKMAGGQLWWNQYDGLQVEAILKGEVRPWFFFILKKCMGIFSIIGGTFKHEPTAAIYLCFFFITFVIFIFSIINNLYFWPLTIHELKRQKEQKKRAHVPENAPRVGVIIPGKNEIKTIVQTVKSTFAQKYPISKTVIVDDGSDDGMSDQLIKTFGFKDCPEEMERLSRPQPLPAQGVVKRILKAGNNLYLIIKENAGKGYAMNEGINFCSEEKFICILDADTIPDPDGLLLLVYPMIEDDRVKITSGRNQFVNGCVVEDGLVKKPVIPDNFYLVSQIREFFRWNCSKAFFNSINAQMVLVGNFSCYNKEIVLKLNGFAERGLTEDCDFNMQAHELSGHEPGILIKSQVLARGWTQAPYTLEGVFHQRVRWAGGIFDCYLKYRNMALKPRHGFVGMFAIPQNWVNFILFPCYFLINFLGVPINAYFFLYGSTGKVLMDDFFYFYYLPAFILFFFFEVVVANYLDWKFIGSYDHKRDYIYTTIYHLLTGWVFESILTVCTAVGYWRTLQGYGSWGKAERTAL
jgi:cellulose synthase/poly-beta-1,6-N-acetylglucosamine synthase-like glycosyltransferase